MVNVVELGDFRVATLNQSPVGCAVLVDRYVTDDAEYGFKISQSVFGGFGTRKLFVIKRNRSIRVLDGNQRLVEATFCNGASCASLAR